MVVRGWGLRRGRMRWVGSLLGRCDDRTPRPCKEEDAAIDGVFGVLLRPGAACMRREGNWVCLILAGGLAGNTRTNARYMYTLSPSCCDETGLRILLLLVSSLFSLGQWTWVGDVECNGNVCGRDAGAGRGKGCTEYLSGNGNDGVYRSLSIASTQHRRSNGMGFVLFFEERTTEIMYLLHPYLGSRKVS